MIAGIAARVSGLTSVYASKVAYDVNNVNTHTNRGVIINTIVLCGVFFITVIWLVFYIVRVPASVSISALIIILIAIPLLRKSLNVTGEVAPIYKILIFILAITFLMGTVYLTYMF